MSKVLVIGLDGATFDLIDPWIEEGKLPILAQCIKEGTRSTLQSTPLSNSAQAWSSFLTGKNPGKHGIYDFFEAIGDGYGVRFLNASFRKGKSLWRLASDAGKKVGVVNVPMTYPPEAVNGFLIPGLDAPGIDNDFAYPGDLMEEINEKVGGYILEAGIWGYIRRGKPGIALQKLLEMVKIRTAAAKYLMQNRTWDLFVVVYTAPDKAQHHFWKYIDPARPEFLTEPYSSAILQVYQEVDKGIGELMASAGGASVIIVSDHGAGPSSRRTMYINRWLHREGFLQFKNPGTISGPLGRFKYSLLERSNNQVNKLLPRKTKEVILRLFPRLRDRVESILSLPGIDWSRTVAYARENHPAIFINTAGREAKGIIDPGDEYENIRDQIIENLKKLRCPDTGKRIVGGIFKREEVYHGPELFRAPDIIFQWNQFLHIHRPSGNSLNKDFLETLDDKSLLDSESTSRPSGIHRDHGIFIGLGKPFHKNTSMAEARIYDLATTILYLLGLRIPEDMDGVVLQEAMEGEYLRRNPVESFISGRCEAGDDAHLSYSKRETRALEERLRGLGYID
jgi:predicted AlkP superfamily phosphohydrolase/phosphomutase